MSTDVLSSWNIVKCVRGERGGGCQYEHCGLYTTSVFGHLTFSTATDNATAVAAFAANCKGQKSKLQQLLLHLALLCTVSPTLFLLDQEF